MKPEPMLMFTCGLPGSGKTTYLERLSEKVGVVSRDQIRDFFGAYTKDKERKVVEICKNTVQAYLLNEQDAVFDSTALSPADRMRILWWAKELYATGQTKQEVRVRCYYFPCGVEDSIKRREGTISKERILEMAKYHREPTKKEGFEVLSIGDPHNDPLPRADETWTPPAKKEDPVADSIKAQ